jgi:arabinofuranan 3-O-arabinosyltransferase
MACRRYPRPLGVGHSTDYPHRTWRLDFPLVFPKDCGAMGTNLGSTVALKRDLAALGIVLWLIALADVGTPMWYRTDLLYFYSLSTLSARGQIAAFADAEAQYQSQIEVLPSSADLRFAPPAAYGPQLMLLVLPLSLVSYGTALVVWPLLTAALYFGIVTAIVVRSTALASHKSTVYLAAAVFPPFWWLVQFGHPTLLSVAATTAAWALMSRGHNQLAAVSLGVLSYKATLFVPVVTLLVLTGSWRAAALALISGFIQGATVCMWLGHSAITLWVQVLLTGFARVTSSSIPFPGMMFSWHAFWQLLLGSGRLELLVYFVSSVVTLVVGGRGWRRCHDSGLKMSALLLTTVLVSPHIYVYDLVILAPAWLWLTQWYLRDPWRHRRLGVALHLGYLLPLLTFVASRWNVQLATPCYLWILAEIAFCRISPSPSFSSGTEGSASEGSVALSDAALPFLPPLAPLTTRSLIASRSAFGRSPVEW